MALKAFWGVIGLVLCGLPSLGVAGPQKFSLGERTSLSDVTWLQFLVGPTEGQDLAWLRSRIETALDLDPLFAEGYQAGATALAILWSDAPGAKVLVDKGIAFAEGSLNQLPVETRQRYWPRPWSLYITKAYIELFELDNIEAAALAFSRASTFPGAPDYLKRLAQNLAHPEGKWEVAKRLIAFQVSGTQDPLALAKLESRAHSLEVIHFLASVQTRNRALPSKDPWGGVLSVDGSGHVQTTTPYTPVFGLSPRPLKTCRSTKNMAC